MKIYDITQELFSCKVFPGDPSPERQVQLRIADGDICNLTAFQMCAHNGTHVITYQIAGSNVCGSEQYVSE